MKPSGAGLTAVFDQKMLVYVAFGQPKRFFDSMEAARRACVAVARSGEVLGLSPTERTVAAYAERSRPAPVRVTAADPEPDAPRARPRKGV